MRSHICTDRKSVANAPYVAAFIRSGALTNEPSRMRRLVTALNQHSTEFNQELLVGVKRSWNHKWAAQPGLDRGAIVGRVVVENDGGSRAGIGPELGVGWANGPVSGLGPGSKLARQSTRAPGWSPHLGVPRRGPWPRGVSRYCYKTSSRAMPWREVCDSASGKGSYSS